MTMDAGIVKRSYPPENFLSGIHLEDGKYYIWKLTPLKAEIKELRKE